MFYLLKLAAWAAFGQEIANDATVDLILQKTFYAYEEKLRINYTHDFNSKVREKTGLGTGKSIVCIYYYS